MTGVSLLQAPMRNRSPGGVRLHPSRTSVRLHTGQAAHDDAVEALHLEHLHCEALGDELVVVLAVGALAVPAARAPSANQPEEEVHAPCVRHSYK